LEYLNFREMGIQWCILYFTDINFHNLYTDFNENKNERSYQHLI
jgi:hypothetical protein